MGQSRAAPRAKVFQPAILTDRVGGQRVHLLDVSEIGALIHADRVPEVNAIVRIECAGLSRLVQVMWVNAKRFGVRFAASLSAEQLAQIVTAREASSQPERPAATPARAQP